MCKKETKKKLIDDEDYSENLDKEIDKTRLKYTSGDRISEVLRRESLTQLDLEVMIGTSTSTISNAMTGVRLLQIEHALKIYEKLGYSLDWLYGITDVAKPDDQRFMVDIRKLISFRGDSMRIRFSSKLYEYIERVSEIEKQRNNGDLSSDEYAALLDLAEKKYLRIRFGGKDVCADINISDIEYIIKGTDDMVIVGE